MSETSGEAREDQAPVGETLLEREALHYIRELIRIDSVNTGDPRTIGDGETRAARLVLSALAEVGLEGELVESTPGRGNVVARLRGAGPDGGPPERGALVVHAHLDVVPVDGQDWRHPPFGAEIHDGLLYGRGAVDMKNFAGVLVAVARSYAREGFVPPRDLVFAFFADEEAGGTWGAKWLVEHRPDLFAGATEALSEVGGFSVPIPPASPGELGSEVPDAAGAPDRPRRAYLVATAEKGVAWARITARGRPGHGSRPTPDNPVVRIGRAVAAIGDHRFPFTRTPALEVFLQRFGEARGQGFPDAAADVEAELAGLGFTGSLLGAGARDTASPTVLDAGSKTNVIPGVATASLDLRVLPGHEDSFIEELRDVVGADVELEVSTWIAPIASPVDAPIVAAMQQAIEADDPEGLVVPYLLPASTDNKHLSRLGIAGYGFVPLRVPDGFDVFGQFHTADEHIPVDALAFSARVTERLLRLA
ncbi:M20/M25/M40 family metallo-hydrolase [Agromyces sp. CF514]|uniref:M20/M25/M40 family metallo-hydrolase n=1 Tax=Agromyces sp. CF514 TaxID=1881031 RepID=UPI0021013C7D|nr:M20/M25/M40 family metallo-hydrolase [Agromyces sp. CF514]